MIDVCTTCRCTTQVGTITGFKLECRKTTCEACPVVREGRQDPGDEPDPCPFWLWTIFDNLNEETESHPPKLHFSEIIII